MRASWASTCAASCSPSSRLPLFLSESRLNLASAIVVICMVAVSLVVLTGWAGQVSLGQVAFLGIGAAVGGWLTAGWGWDLGARSSRPPAWSAPWSPWPSASRRCASRACSSPWPRWRSPLATSSYVLNHEFVTLAAGRPHRPRTRSSAGSPSNPRPAIYYLCLVCLLVARSPWSAASASSRTGRVLIGVRENERGAQAYGVNVTSAKLTAFAISGFIAAVAGALYVHQQQSLGISPYAVDASFQVFIMVVIGGLGSIPGALLGAIFIEGLEYFRRRSPPSSGRSELLTTGVGLVIVLLFLPGGFSQLYYDLRDRILARVADRRGIHVPSLVADSRRRAPRPATADARSSPTGADRRSTVDAALTHGADRHRRRSR